MHDFEEEKVLSNLIGYGHDVVKQASLWPFFFKDWLFWLPLHADTPTCGAMHIISSRNEQYSLIEVQWGSHYHLLCCNVPCPSWVSCSATISYKPSKERSNTQCDPEFRGPLLSSFFALLCTETVTDTPFRNGCLERHSNLLMGCFSQSTAYVNIQALYSAGTSFLLAMFPLGLLHQRVLTL